jgi:NMD protein affecting ribosome stability and mRNA decay
MSFQCFNCQCEIRAGEVAYRGQDFDGMTIRFCVPCGEQEMRDQIMCPHERVDEEQLYDDDGWGYRVLRCRGCGLHGRALERASGLDENARAAALAAFEAKLAEERMTDLVARSSAGGHG